MNFIEAPKFEYFSSVETFLDSGLIFVFAALILLWIFRERIHRLGSRTAPRRPYRWRPKVVSKPRAGDASDPLQQMNFVAKVEFSTTPLLNREEQRVFAVLEETVARLGSDLRLMAQTSLGEVIRPTGGGTAYDRKQAHSSINSKRLDFAVFDARGTLILAIEYQGSGHYHEKSFIRDAVKKEALRKAGVPFLEVAKGSRPGDLREQVYRILAPDEALPSKLA